ncbi:hypothetical protein [Nocardioides ferulae]|uniref:hypothetical protein n=1 Tax=Nocardioides ferulae TaxID=2340821 RepID=UPI000F85F2C7|nr:hypothetical protein [Nocardioides ferulae]
MRNLLRLPAVSLLALTLFVGCSGDDEKEPEADPSPTAEVSQEGPAPAQERGCKVEVEVTGTVEASWTGKATVRLSEEEPTAIYQAQDGESSIAVYSPLNDNPASANVTVGDSTFTTPLGDDTGLEVAEDGSGAAVAADATGIDDNQVRIDAVFECGKPKKGSSD